LYSCQKIENYWFKVLKINMKNILMNEMQEVQDFLFFSFTIKVNLTTLLYWDSSVSNSATLFWAFARSRLSDSKSSVQICIWALSALIVSASLWRWLSSWPICPHCTSDCNFVSSADLLISCWFLSSSSSCNCKKNTVYDVIIITVNNFFSSC